MQAPTPLGLVFLRLAYFLTALGIGYFWFDWFSTGAYLHAGTECYRAFENSFPLPDGVLSAVLLTESFFMYKRHQSAIPWGFLAAGMLLALAMLDATYGLQHGGFSDWSGSDTYKRLFICAYCATLGIVTLLYLPTKYNWFLFDFADSTPLLRRTCLILGALLVIFYVISGPIGLLHSASANAAYPCLKEFYTAHVPAFGYAILGLAISATLIIRQSTKAAPATLFTLGGLLFLRLLSAQFVLNPFYTHPLFLIYNLGLVFVFALGVYACMYTLQYEFPRSKS